jgi:FkbM family methyltransferase
MTFASASRDHDILRVKELFPSAVELDILTTSDRSPSRMRSPRKLAAAAARRILSPFVPARKMLPFKCWLLALDGESEAELVNLERYCGSDGVAVDIGANLGWYTHSLSKRFRRVYAFEVNDEITGLLKQYNPGNIEIIHCGLSSMAGTAKFYVPVAHGLTLEGWGSLYRDNLPGADKYLEKEVPLAPLDDFGIAGVGFVKIDVEGHELEVLKGAAATIARSRPVVLIEVKDKNLQSVHSWFLALNYQRHRLEDFIPVQGQRENYIYVPAERSVQLGLEG